MIALINGKRVNTYNGSSLICPYCGHSEFVSYDTFDGEIFDDIQKEFFICPKCKKTFLGEKTFSVSYETYKCDRNGRKIDEDELEICGKNEEIDDSARHEIDYNGHEYVNLGLPSGTLWAKCNVRAEKETDYGGYYQWGGTENFSNTEKRCNKKTYPYGNGIKSLTKYNTNDEYGFVDNKTELELSNDIVHYEMGGDWHTPSREQLCELVNNTISEWTFINGVYGRLFTSKHNSQSIFIPAAGYREDSHLSGIGVSCYLWSRSLCQAFPSSASDLHFDLHNYSIDDNNRYYGFSVRGVIG